MRPLVAVVGERTVVGFSHAEPFDEGVSNVRPVRGFRERLAAQGVQTMLDGRGTNLAMRLAAQTAATIGRPRATAVSKRAMVREWVKRDTLKRLNYSSKRVNYY